jgi:site-specific DNA-methyltransferase (adenine-specific)
LLDSIFGPENFRNEIIWRRTGSHNSSRRFGPIHDVLFFYSKSKNYYFKPVYQPYLKGHVKSFFKKEDQHGRYWGNALTGAGTRNGQSGQLWRKYNPSAVGRHWAVPGRIATELNLDPGLSVQEKLDAIDEAGFIVHPVGKSSAMPTYRQYLDKSPGMSIQDIWVYQPHTSGVLHGSDKCIDEDVRWLVRQGDRERLGYPTQKPEGLLERIIESSCPEGGHVLDPFCGCGTAVAVAERLDRHWTGIDITILATNLIKSRLVAAFGEEVEFSVIGEPTTLEDAEQLAREDKHQFEAWALGLVGARTETKKKGADGGVDGRLFFQEKLGGKVRQVMISVKGGAIHPSDIRELRGVIEREDAEMGLLISLREPTPAMRSEAATAGVYRSGGEGVGTWGKHPRIQLRTVEELLNGKRIDMPPLTGSLSLPQAPRVERRRPLSEPLFRNISNPQFSEKTSKPSKSTT